MYVLLDKQVPRVLIVLLGKKKLRKKVSQTIKNAKPPTDFYNVRWL